MENKSKYAAVLLETTDGRLIFHHRDNKPYIDNPDTVGVFGGGVEEGESFEETAIREIKEELGLNLTKEDLKYFSIYNKTKKIHGVDEICRVFIVKNIDPSKLNLNRNEGQGVVLISDKDEANKYKLTIMAKDMIDEYFK